MGTYYKGQRYGSSTVKIQDTGEDGLYKAMLDGTAVNVIDDKLTSAIGFDPINVEYLRLKKATAVHFFSGNAKLEHVILDAEVQLKSRQFYQCSKLIDAIVPNEQITGSWTSYQRIYAGCPLLNYIVSGATSSQYEIFEGARNKSLVFTRITNVGNLVSSNLETLVVLTTGATLDSVSYINANSPIAQGTGYIYVPASDVENCKQRTNWITYASQIKGINEQVTLSVGDVFTPSYSGSDVVTWDIVKLCSWDCATINSSTGAITIIDEGYLLVRGLDADGIPVYVAYINSLEVEE